MTANNSKTENEIPRWLEWAREIQAIAQTGLHFAENEYQYQRFQRLSEISAEIFAEHSDLDQWELVSSFDKQIGYATPKIDVRGAVFQDGNLLLVRERANGGWTMPGGWADIGDIPSEAVKREVLEEAGFEVKVRKVIGIYDANRTGKLEVFHAFKIIFLCDIIGGIPRTSYETSEVSFFKRNEIPENLSGERTKERHIIDAFNAMQEDCPTIFD